MKTKIWQNIKTKRFLYALLTAVLLNSFAVGSAQFWQWLIPWRLAEILIWAAAYFTLLAYILLRWDDWCDKHCS
jgi:hypothetical protein